MSSFFKKIASLLSVSTISLGLLVSIPLTISAIPSASAAGLTSCADNGSPSGLTIAASHGAAFYIDSGNTPKLDAGYVGYRVTNNSGSTKKGYWVVLNNFTGGKLSLANEDDKYIPLDDIANAGTKVAYFMLKASGATASAQSHTVAVYDRRPDLVGSNLLRSCTYTFSAVKETIKAAANKVGDNGASANGAISVSNTSPELGQEVTISVEGATGNIGAGGSPDFDSIWLTPAAVSSWPTGALRLKKVSIIFDGNDQGWTTTPTYVDQLLITQANGRSEVDSGYYIATYTFQVIGKPAGTVKAVPVAQIASGTQMKHSDTTGTGATLDISFSGVTIPQTLAKTVPTTSSLETGTVTSIVGAKPGVTYVAVPYRLTLSTTGAAAIIDEIVDTPGVGAIYYSSSGRVTDVGRTSVAVDAIYISTESTLSPRPYHFVGPFNLSSSRSVVIDYKMWLPVGTTPLINSAFALVGTQKIGATASTIPNVSVDTTNGGSGSVTPTGGTTSLGVVATTDPASSIASTSATINGTVDPNGTASTIRFKYGTDPSLSTLLGTVNATPSTSSSTDPISVSNNLTGLTQGTTYYYQVVVLSGTNAVLAQGDIHSFTTVVVASTPVATTVAATSISASGTTLNGTISPNNTLVTKIMFQYSTSSTLSGTPTLLTLQDTSGTQAVDIQTSGIDIQSFSAQTTTLTSGATYYFRIVICTGDTSGGNNPCGNNGVQINGSILSFNLAKASQSITFNEIPNKVYGNSAFTVTTSTSPSNLQVTLTSLTTDVCTITTTTSGTTPIVTTATITILKVGDCTLEATQGGNGSYNPATPVSQTFNIAPATLTVTADNKSKTSGGTDPTFTSTVTGFVSTDLATVSSATYLFSGKSGYNYPISSTTPTDAGLYNIEPTSAALTFSSGSASNYVINYAVGTYTINAAVKSNQTIVIADYSGLVNGSTLNLDTLITNGGAGTGLITYTLDSGNCSISGSTLTATGNGGSCVVTATKAEDAAYNQATDSGTITLVGSYSVTYNDNVTNETISVPTNGTNYTTGQTVTISATEPSRSGYTFNGWTLDSGNTGTVYKTGATSTYVVESSNMIFYAKWTAINYTATYFDNTDAEVITVPTDATNYNIGQTLTISTTEPTRTGYTFQGWTLNSGNTGTVYKTGGTATYTVTAVNISFYAKWSINSYNVTYNYNYGSSPTIEVKSLSFGTNALSLGNKPAITRTGYDLSGWSETNNGSTITSFSVSSDKELFAIWAIKQYTVSYNANGGLTSGSTGVVPVSVTADYNSQFNVSTNSGNLEKTGYTFEGWSTASGTGGTDYAVGAPYTITAAGSQILYARWVAIGSKSVTFNSNFGTATTSTQSSTTNTALSSNPFTRSGYSFVKWTTGQNNSGTVYTNGAQYPFGEAGTASTQILYAQWSPITTVSFNINGGTTSSSNQTCIQGDTCASPNTGIVLPSSPGRSGYTFSGWGTSCSATIFLSNPYYPDSSLTPNSVELCAVWVAVPYTVTYSAGAGTGTVPTQSDLNIGQTFTVAVGTGLSNTGYTFDGWKDQTNTAYAANATYTMPAGNVTLTAQWTANAPTNYTITYATNNSDGGSAPANTTGNGSVTLRTNSGNLTRSGYTFGGWNTATGCSGTNYSAGASFNLTSSVTLYPCWNANSTPTPNPTPDPEPTPEPRSSTPAKIKPVVVWKNPNAIKTTTTLSTTQLNAVATVSTVVTPTIVNPTTPDKLPSSAPTIAGTYVYTPIVPTVVTAGINQVTTVTSAQNALTGTTKTVQTTTPSVPTNTPSTTNVEEKPVLGQGTTLAPGLQKMRVVFIPADPTTYEPVETEVEILVQAETKVEWVDPAPIKKTTPVGPGQLNATGIAPGLSNNVPGTYKYDIPEGTTLPPGKYPVKVTFTPNDPNYLPSTGEVTITVVADINPLATPIVTPSNTPAGKPITNTTPAANAKVTTVGKGLTTATTDGTQVNIVPLVNFSGKTTVTVSVTDEGETKDVVVPVTVLPLPAVTPLTTPNTKGKSTIAWKPSPNAVEYEVTLAGKSICTTTTTSCSTAALIGPKSDVKVVAKGNDETVAPVAPAKYTAPKKPVTALVVYFDTNKFNLDAKDKADIRAIAKVIIEQGFKNVVVNGHTDIRGGVDNQVLSRNRSNATFNYLKELVPGLNVTIGAFASTKPAVKGTSAEALASNRRAEVGVY